MDIRTLINICNKFPDVRIKAIKDKQLTEHYILDMEVGKKNLLSQHYSLMVKDI